ncbi:putative serine/threonine protein kinase, putative,protein kinase [Trypanosoma conorhini]|uniref:non-specific serine/threonine protein kinase n=1 Tax=Trypanosoma conorhini TaxID=83891 RepID=A0A3R7N3L8_9TRYP|nr:putative serine/threonine protein kinase, putative,protein kinase [Trypanosoma conorhini]RNF24898.1 putative serine/threonine protein kinase, putative,protein kinase [Trypanosoma conorhini]
MRKYMWSPPAPGDGARVFAGGDAAEAPEGSSPRACGELAIVPPHSELQLAPRSQSPCMALAHSGVCPTCHRPLNTSPAEELPLSPAERRFSPQYFRALVQANAQHLSICDSPSFCQQRRQQQQGVETPETLQQVRMSSRPRSKRAADAENEEKTKEEEEATGVSREASAGLAELARGEEANVGGEGVSDHGGYYRRYFREIQKLGNGTFGGVYLCQHVMEGVALGYFALKKIPVGDNVEYLQKVLREVRILEEVKQHPNVVEYNHSWVDVAQLADFGPPVRCLFILMEYATLGSLDSYLELHGTALPTIAVWYFFLSALAGTVHLHKKNILHRDLKPQNLLLTGAPEKPPRVLVSDFGTATLLEEVSYERTGGTGTVEYMAPELFECSSESSGTYINAHTKASDVWSLGMILHYLACNGTLPARLPNGAVVLNVEESAPFIRPPEMVELIRAMLHRNPAKRPTCNELLKSTVVQTILRSFENASHFTDILPTAAVTPARNSPSLRGKKRDTAGRSIHVRRGENDSATSCAHDWNAPHDNEEEEASQQPHSPVVEVPLMLQYRTMESKRVTSAGARGVQKGRRITMVDQAVQTDYVKIVYE